MAQRNYSPRFEPLAIWGDDASTGRRAVVGMHESLMQLSIVTPQTRRAQQFPIEHKQDRDNLVAAFEKAIASLKGLQNLPDAPVAATPAKSGSAAAAPLPANVITSESLADLLAAERRSTEKLLADTMSQLMAVLKPAESAKAAVATGNGQAAVKNL